MGAMGRHSGETKMNRKCENCCFFVITAGSFGECAVYNHKTVNKDMEAVKNNCKKHLYKQMEEK